MSVYRVAICIPCQDQVSGGFAVDLSRLVRRTTLEREDITLTVLMNRGTIIPQQRATLVTMALQWNPTHILWLDADMRFPDDALMQLLEHKEPIVAANYPTRRAPILPTAEHITHGYLFTMPDSEGLAEVTRCGMGVMLVDMSVFTTMPQPWFQLGFDPKTGDYAGEDFFFCAKAKQFGFTTLIDQTLSQKVQHDGALAFTQQHANATREQYLAAQEA